MNTTMTENPAAVLYAERDIRIEDRPIPEPGQGEVVVAIEAVGICGSDVHYYEHGRVGDFVVEQPMVIGHESAGRIVGVGGGVDEARVGELVALEPGIPDFTCNECLHGRYNLCPNVRFFATPPVDGAIARFVAHPAAFAHAAPAGLTPEQAAMAEPVSVGVWASRKAGVTVGDRVLITGAGPIGLFAAQVARAFGATDVTLTDTNPFRLSVASDLGFTALQAGSGSPDDRYDVLLECSGAPAAFVDGIGRMARAGRVVLVGMGADEVPLPVARVQSLELSLTGIFRYANTYADALRLIAAGDVDVRPVITHRFTLEQTADALELARREPESLKAVVRPYEK